MDWHERCVVHFTWAKHGRPMTVRWVDGVLDRALELSAEAMIFGIQLGGHVAYESKLSPRIPDMEADVLARLCAGGHKRGLKIVPYWLTTSGGCAVEALEHPDWLSVGPDGKRLAHLCYNTPFGEFQEGQVREVLAGYPVDGIFFDQLSAACYCSYCLNAFRSEYGGEMPRESQFGRFPGQAFLDDPAAASLLRSFRIASARRFCRRIRLAIDEVRPGTVYIQNWIFGPAAEACAEYVDAILPEQHLSTDIDAMPIGNRLVGAYGGKAVWANVSHAYHHHATVHTVEHTQLLLMQGAAARCSPNIIELNALDDNMGGFADLKEALRQVRWATDALKGCAAVKYAAVLHSRFSEELGDQEFRAATAGIYDVLAYQQIPFEFITEKTVQAGGLAGFKVLILPNATHLADATVDAIGEFVRGGGGLVATYQSGMFDEAGRRRESSPIAALAGVRQGTVVAWSQDVEYPNLDAQVPIPSLDFRPGRPYFRYVRLPQGSAIEGGLRGRLLSFSGPYVEVEATPVARTAAHILEMDQQLVNMRPFNRRGQFPGQPRWPLITLRDGPGRVSYVAAFLEPRRNRSDCYDLDRLLRNTILWAGGTPPIAVSNFPPTVHLTLSSSADGSRLVVVLTNQTTHPIEHGNIRYVVPVADLQLRIKTNGKQIKAVAAGSGQATRLVQKGDEAVITVPRLAVAECLTLAIAPLSRRELRDRRGPPSPRSIS